MNLSDFPRMLAYAYIVTFIWAEPMILVYYFGAIMAIEIIINVVSTSVENITALKYDVSDEEVEQYMRENGFK